MKHRKNPFYVLGGNAYAGVCDRDHHLPRWQRLDPYADCPTRRSEFNGVVREIQQYLMESIPVSPHHVTRLGPCDAEFDALLYAQTDLPPAIMTDTPENSGIRRFFAL